MKTSSMAPANRRCQQRQRHPLRSTKRRLAPRPAAASSSVAVVALESRRHEEIDVHVHRVRVHEHDRPERPSAPRGVVQSEQVLHGSGDDAALAVEKEKRDDSNQRGQRRRDRRNRAQHAPPAELRAREQKRERHANHERRHHRPDRDPQDRPTSASRSDGLDANSRQSASPCPKSPRRPRCWGTRRTRAGSGRDPPRLPPPRSLAPRAANAPTRLRGAAAAGGPRRDERHPLRTIRTPTLSPRCARLSGASTSSDTSSATATLYAKCAGEPSRRDDAWPSTGPSSGDSANISGRSTASAATPGEPDEHTARTRIGTPPMVITAWSPPALPAPGSTARRTWPRPRRGRIVELSGVPICSSVPCPSSPRDPRSRTRLPGRA